MNVFSEKSKWISVNDILTSKMSKRISAPYFRREYEVNGSNPVPAVLKFCGIGLAELYFNGAKLTPGELDPAPSVYDHHCYFREYHIDLQPGTNVFGIILGNGFYNQQSNDFWQFFTAPWRDYPKMIFELSVNGKTVLASDTGFKYTIDTPIVFNNWHGGEYYDSREEIKGWLEAGFDDSKWEKAAIKPGPGGELVPEIMPAVKVFNTFEVKNQIKPFVYDAGKVITGRIRIFVRGEAGSVITAKYSDHLSPDGEFTQVDLGQFIPGDEVQTDRYTLHTKYEAESWSPRFVFHSFRYIKISIYGNAEIVKIEAEEMSSGFERIGNFSTAHDIMQKLYDASVNSYTGNFVGIPTDCPHREKNGWTADAAFATDSGLMTFDSACGYRRYLQCLQDNQRISGQLPGITPSPGWGYNYGSSPVWDSALWVIPYSIYVNTGDDIAIRKHYDAIALHLEYTATLADSETMLISSVLGDHCHPYPEKSAPVEFISTAFYALEAGMMAKFAALLGKKADEEKYKELKNSIVKALLAAFPDREESTALALYMVLGAAKDDTMDKLIRAVENNKCKADFGIVGAKYIPRLLSDYGRSDLAFNIMTQTEYPGYGNWIARGATTLWEYWDGGFSQNHIMFGDVIAWAMCYPGGIRPSWENPGFKKLELKPVFPDNMPSSCVTWRHECGKLQISWARQDNGEIILDIDAPCDGTVEIAGDVRQVSRGQNRYTVQP